MEIKVVLHSELDCHLKPDIDLIKKGLVEIQNGGKLVDPSAVDGLIKYVSMAETLIAKESELAKKMKAASEEEKPAIKEEKEKVGDKADVALEEALNFLIKAGGKDAYHYDYDDHFNMVVAGLMGSTCYMKDDFKALQDKRIRNIIAIANTVLNNGHHSTFGHAHVTLEITGIPKALAMTLNNEHDYNTSEKSARYTVYDEIPPRALELYNKWKSIFIRLIDKKYGKCQPFFDKKGVKTGKLAQENARYMIPVFAPTNMVYTTDFRQLSYICHWLEDEIANPNSNLFYKGIKKEMREFVDYAKDNGFYLENLEDHKDRKLSLFGPGALWEHVSSESYTFIYKSDLATLAQTHRHRTGDCRINDYKFRFAPVEYCMPKIISTSDEPWLVKEWEQDINSINQEEIPQGRMVEVIESGTARNFLLKAKERECSQAQLAIMQQTQAQSQKFSAALGEEIMRGEAYAESLTGLDKEDALNSLASIKEMKATFDKLSVGARCTAGYKCTAPCGFKEGIDLTREI